MAHDFDKDATVEKCLAELGLTSLDEKLPKSVIRVHSRLFCDLTRSLKIQLRYLPLRASGMCTNRSVMYIYAESSFVGYGSDLAIETRAQQYPWWYLS